MRRSAEPSGFEIWHSGDRIHSIDNPVRREILAILEEGGRNLNELVAATGKAKSTLSALHLPPLLEGGLVEEVPDPRDHRTKTYRLTGRRLGRSDVDADRLRDAVFDYARISGHMPLSEMLKVLEPESLLASHANPDYVERVAQRLGSTVGGMLTSRRLEEAIEELAGLFSNQGLGRLTGSPDQGLRLEPANPQLQTFLAKVVDAALQDRYGPVRWRP